MNSAGKNKFGAVYAQLACLPASIASSIDSIFLSLLIHAEDAKRKKYLITIRLRCWLMKLIISLKKEYKLQTILASILFDFS